MSKPNKSVGNWRAKVGFPAKEAKPVSAFVEWCAANPLHAASFGTIEAAQKAFEQEQLDKQK